MKFPLFFDGKYDTEFMKTNTPRSNQTQQMQIKIGKQWNRLVFFKKKMFYEAQTKKNTRFRHLVNASSSIPVKPTISFFVP